MDGALDDGARGENSSFQNYNGSFQNRRPGKRSKDCGVLMDVRQIHLHIHLQPATCWYKGYVTSNI